jgi:hypothetical protein
MGEQTGMSLIERGTSAAVALGTTALRLHVEPDARATGTRWSEYVRADQLRWGP